MAEGGDIPRQLDVESLWKYRTTNKKVFRKSTAEEISTSQHSLNSTAPRINADSEVFQGYDFKPDSEQSIVQQRVLNIEHSLKSVCHTKPLSNNTDRNGTHTYDTRFQRQTVIPQTVINNDTKQSFNLSKPRKSLSSVRKGEHRINQFSQKHTFVPQTQVSNIQQRHIEQSDIHSEYPTRYNRSCSAHNCSIESTDAVTQNYNFHPKKDVSIFHRKGNIEKSTNSELPKKPYIHLGNRKELSLKPQTQTVDIKQTVNFGYSSSNETNPKNIEIHRSRRTHDSYQNRRSRKTSLGSVSPASGMSVMSEDSNVKFPFSSTTEAVIPKNAKHNHLSKKPPPMKRDCSNKGEGDNLSKSRSDCHPRFHKADMKHASEMKQKTSILPTVVFMKFVGEISSETLSSYIKNRIDNSIDFEVVSIPIESKDKTTQLTVQFKSKRKAQKAINLINKSNTQSETQIYCCFNRSELEKMSAHDACERQKYFTTQCDEVKNRSQKMIAVHNNKLLNLKEELSTIKRYIQTNGYMPIAEFEVAEAEKKAIADKIEEMERQLYEFNMYVTKMLSEIEAVSDSNTYVQKIRDLRNHFGVECTRLNDCLPMYARRTEIIETVKNNQVSIVIGETGSGKSTQMTQFLYEAGLSNTGLIACTQPRKVAASNLATHVAKQMAVSVGGLVGYQVGCSSKSNYNTRILYLTDHSLLNECLKDAMLSKYSCIIIDEAHERSIYTDLLIGMLKNCLPLRPDLRIVITSATINPDIFINYFGKETPVLKVSGRAYPVEVIWRSPFDEDEEFTDYQNKAVNKAVDVHTNEPPGDILVFVTTPLEAERCCELFTKQLINQKQTFVCLELHGKIRLDEQQKVFREYENGIRKVVFATNSAETSVTIPGVKYVIDTGLVKEMNYDAKRSLNALNTNMVTQSSAEQRKGRAGRTGAGKCYRLYKEQSFKKMRVDAVPEIMRIHLGHALLKLMELGVNPLQFDFVESPPEDSIRVAMESLEELGAVELNKITSLGEWLAKLPLEPYFGAFLYHAIREDIGMEALIIASTCCSPGSMFFRGGSDKEKENSDKLKSRFCHEGGDLLTSLDVYREWFQLPEKSKTKWCLENSLNSKALRGIRETSKEILIILRKDLKPSFKEIFHKPHSVVDCKIQKLLFRIFHVNLCHYLGHEKAGYLFIAKEQQVHLFPSSTLKALGSWPDWITFIQVMQTSRQFAMNVLPVLEEDILQGIEEGWLKLDIDEVKKKKLKPVSTTLIGKSMYTEFVGPRYCLLRNLENDIQTNCNGSIAIIDANREQGVVKVYCTDEHSNSIATNVENYAQPLRDKFKQEEKEESIGQEGTGVRAMLTAGGEVRDIFMADEYFTVHIKSAPNRVKTLTEAEVDNYFRQYGAIKSCEKFNFRNKPPYLWGTVTFVESASAKFVIESQSKDVELSASVNKKTIPENADSQFSAKLIWLRRKSKGFGFVEFREPEEVHAALRMRSFHVAGSFIKISPSKNHERKPNEVFIGGFNSDLTEDVIRAEIGIVLNLHPINDILNVIIIRDKVSDTNENLNTIYNRISARIEPYCAAGKKSFKLNLITPKPGSVNYVAFVHFVKVEEGHRAYNEINDNFVINNANVRIVPQLKSRIFIPKQILTAVRDQLQLVLSKLENDNNEIVIKQTELANGNLTIDISSEVIEPLSMAKSAIETVVKKEIIDFQNENEVHQFFTYDGRQVIKAIEDKVGGVIMLDRRTFTVATYGSIEQQRAAKLAIFQYLENSVGKITKQVKLAGPERPVGVMRAILIRYGCDLQVLKRDAQLSSIDLTFRSHTLTFVGTQESVMAASQIVDDIIASLDQSPGLRSDNDDTMDCSTCLCPIDENPYRLEFCGHAYCDICLRQQMKVAIETKEFPVRCGKDNCDEPFVLQDFQNLCRLKYFYFPEWISSSVGCYVARNKNRINYCLTPDCEMVYKTTKEGNTFRCPLCALTICTSCHVPFHGGMTCSIFKIMKVDDNATLLSWVNQNSTNRKLCPSCSTAIEKNGGCQHMTCTECKKHICWRCMEFFSTQDDCYRHLSKKHGGFN